MYIPKDFENNNLDQLHQLIEKFNFATIISVNTSGEIVVSHIPVMLDRAKGPNGTLIWHMANQNDHVNMLNDLNMTLCIFHGPHAYISHSWYQSEPSVPTWNYAVVHAHGVPTKASEGELSDDLSRLVLQHESIINRLHYPIAEDYKSKLIKHITGFRMEITKIEGKYKLGQNRSKEDQHCIKEVLSAQPDSQVLAELMGDVSSSL
jgi:transcriptional regulator